MVQIRRFTSDMKVKLPGGHPGVYGVPIQMDSARLPEKRRAAFAERMGGLPILLNCPTQIEAMYFEPRASIDEHSAPHPIIFMVIGGAGFVRIGGPDGETRAIQAGDAVLWPAGLDHTVWTEDEPMRAIVVNSPEERA
jgi:quercetin dioxygenase-like cupin family protein